MKVAMGEKRRIIGDEEKGSCLETLQKVLEQTAMAMRHGAAADHRKCPDRGLSHKGIATVFCLFLVFVRRDVLCEQNGVYGWIAWC